MLENIGSCLIPIEEMTGTIVNRRCYLKRFIGWQKNPSKFKYFEIKTYNQKTGPYLLIRGNEKIRKGGCNFNVIARVGIPIGPFSSAKEIWNWSKGGLGLGVSIQKLEKLLKNKPEAWLYPLEGSRICSEDEISWYDQVDNNTRFLSAWCDSKELFRFDYAQRVLKTLPKYAHLAADCD